MSRLLLVFALLSLVKPFFCHSWIEELDVILPNSTLISPPGYPRGYAPRLANVPVDREMTWKLPPDGRAPPQLLQTDNICKPSQVTHVQTPNYEKLTAAAGSTVCLRYQENGHITCPQFNPGKVSGGGYVYVYGTNSSSQDDAILNIHGQWTAEGGGGDGRGRLLNVTRFDDGQCYTANPTCGESTYRSFKHIPDPPGPNRWCGNIVSLPGDLPEGSLYTIYWVWDYSSADGSPAFYTTCMDILIQ